MVNFPIQMYDPKREYRANKEKIDDAIHRVLDHGIFINGPEVKELEKKLCEYNGSKHCIAVSNGTDALKIALLALGVGVDDEVITVAHTWISTSEMISIINARPVFVEVEPETFNMDVTKIEAAINFIRSGGEKVVITSGEHLQEAFEGKSGTLITKK